MPSANTFRLAIVTVLVTVSSLQIFLPGRQAVQFLRQKRAYQVFEETKKGHLERECVEEQCSKEEAREVFENDPETDYFYPKYLDCIHQYGSPYAKKPEFITCVHNLPDQCSLQLCNPEGTVRCDDVKGDYICNCKDGWRGKNCEEDIDECQVNNGSCHHICKNKPGSYHCLCQNGYFLLPDNKTCHDVDECKVSPDICGEANCVNLDSSYECQCHKGFKYDASSKSCKDVDECAAAVCAQTCINSHGSYSCLCDGSAGLKLGSNMHSCESILPCASLTTARSIKSLFLGRLFSGIPVARQRFRRKQHTKFTAEFDFRTYDPEGIILFAGSQKEKSWILLAIRNGKIELQLKYKGVGRVTSSGPVINDGKWHTICVEESNRNLIIKVNKEAVMKIAISGDLFSLNRGLYELNLTIGGAPFSEENLVQLINPRMDGCMKGWNFLSGEDATIQETVRLNEKMQCFASVEKGSYYPGKGFASFSINYTHPCDRCKADENWAVKLKADIHPVTDTGVMFALVEEDEVILSLALVDYHHTHKVKDQYIVLAIKNMVISRVNLTVCDAQEHIVKISVTKHQVTLTADGLTGQTDVEKSKLDTQLGTLHRHMQDMNMKTYLGGLPAKISTESTPVTAFYIGCMSVEINDKVVDLDEANQKHSNIMSHSCPPLSANQ
ncbi:growth arrest-specific protein 6 isoform X1 [Protopterus annectens]|uniref:growth arrest-specific protein 6 isoform X1 n=1 Tax=Protopterus annectens TaxID=7888 RepID=UPI001CFBEC53|nr:growth arrest-specific protein 6 isoform X1 [Protopterus annectens]XP_043927052.1 growth arrest-specific protein 6 isoform X1 [Protopterus annectens]XP_043927053.1 growth arrest-specific protein 6 isoform X1 [Protopterus annectens]